MKSLQFFKFCHWTFCVRFSPVNIKLILCKQFSIAVAVGQKIAEIPGESPGTPGAPGGPQGPGGPGGIGGPGGQPGTVTPSGPGTGPTPTPVGPPGTKVEGNDGHYINLFSIIISIVVQYLI